jgi:hypothetical protein
MTHKERIIPGRIGTSPETASVAAVNPVGRGRERLAANEVKPSMISTAEQAAGRI